MEIEPVVCEAEGVALGLSVPLRVSAMLRVSEGEGEGLQVGEGLGETEGLRLRVLLELRLGEPESEALWVVVAPGVAVSLGLWVALRGEAVRERVPLREGDRVWERGEREADMDGVEPVRVGDGEHGLGVGERVVRLRDCEGGDAEGEALRVLTAEALVVQVGDELKEKEEQDGDHWDKLRLCVGGLRDPDRVRVSRAENVDVRLGVGGDREALPVGGVGEHEGEDRVTEEVADGEAVRECGLETVLEGVGVAVKLRDRGVGVGVRDAVLEGLKVREGPELEQEVVAVGVGVKEGDGGKEIERVGVNVEEGLWEGLKLRLGVGLGVLVWPGEGLSVRLRDVLHDRVCAGLLLLLWVVLKVRVATGVVVKDWDGEKDGGEGEKEGERETEGVPVGVLPGDLVKVWLQDRDGGVWDGEGLRDLLRMSVAVRVPVALALSLR